MSKDLFQIGTESDIYLIMDLWAMLSPKLKDKESDKALFKRAKGDDEKQNNGYK